MNEKPPGTERLKKVLGFTSLFIITIGIVVSQTSVVSLVQGAGLGFFYCHSDGIYHCPLLVFCHSFKKSFDVITPESC